MSSIFISHASQDTAAAKRVSAHLQQHGFESLFLDASEDQGLVAGAVWERELYRKTLWRDIGTREATKKRAELEG